MLFCRLLIFFKKSNFSEKNFRNTIRVSNILDPDQTCHFVRPGTEVIKLEHSLKLKIKRNDWLLADTCPQAANHSTLF